MKTPVSFFVLLAFWALLSNHIRSQWVLHASDPAQLNRGTTGGTSPVFPPASDNSRMVWIKDSDRLLLVADNLRGCFVYYPSTALWVELSPCPTFGDAINMISLGGGKAITYGQTDELQKYDASVPDDGAFTEISVSTPAALSNGLYASAIWPDATRTGFYICFGYAGAGDIGCDTMYHYDDQNTQWASAIAMSGGDTTPTCANVGYWLDGRAADDKLYVYGGSCQKFMVAEMAGAEPHSWTLLTDLNGVAVEHYGSPPFPGRRLYSQMRQIPGTQYAVMYGGSSIVENYGDLWVLDMDLVDDSKNGWLFVLINEIDDDMVPTTGRGPVYVDSPLTAGHRSGAAMAITDAGELFLFGGFREACYGNIPAGVSNCGAGVTADLWSMSQVAFPLASVAPYLQCFVPPASAQELSLSVTGRFSDTLHFVFAVLLSDSTCTLTIPQPSGGACPLERFDGSAVSWAFSDDEYDLPVTPDDVVACAAQNMFTEVSGGSGPYEYVPVDSWVVDCTDTSFTEVVSPTIYLSRTLTPTVVDVTVVNLLADDVGMMIDLISVAADKTVLSEAEEIELTVSHNVNAMKLKITVVGAYLSDGGSLRAPVDAGNYLVDDCADPCVLAIDASDPLVFKATMPFVGEQGANGDAGTGAPEEVRIVSNWASYSQLNLLVSVTTTARRSASDGRSSVVSVPIRLLAAEQWRVGENMPIIVREFVLGAVLGAVVASVVWCVWYVRRRSRSWRSASGRF